MNIIHNIHNSIRTSIASKLVLTMGAILVVLTMLVGIYIILKQVATMENIILDKAHLAARLGARQYSSVFESALNFGMLTVSDVFDRNYLVIKGYNWGDKPKYHTRYDTLTDNAVLKFEDEIIDQDNDFVFAVGVDENGYVPTHNTRYQNKITGNLIEDLEGNRSKCIFNDPVGLAAAQNTQPLLQQIYKLDTGATMWDVSAPIFVRGKHWGGFRVGVSMKQLKQQTRHLLLTFTVIFSCLILVVMGVMYAMIRNTLQPIEEITIMADQISLGESVNTPLQSDRTDEIGRLVDAINGLRISMNIAIARLSK